VQQEKKYSRGAEKSLDRIDTIPWFRDFIMAEFQVIDVKKYLGEPRKPLDRIDRKESKSNSVNSVKPLLGESPEKKVSVNIQGVRIEGRPDTIPRLPFALERLVSAAGSNLLAGFTFEGVPDINRYVLAWASTYLVGDSTEALDRLRQVQIAREASS